MLRHGKIIKCTAACIPALLLISVSRLSGESERDNGWTVLREMMVSTQIEARGVSDEATLAAMRKVPRHRFVTREYLSRAYEDRPLPIGEGQTISQPYIVAFMCEKLALRPGQRVLEVGAGSGYHAAVISKIAGEVYTVEIIPSLAARASRVLEEEGYDNVRVKTGDGYFGWEEHAPYDAIIVTAAATHIPPPLIRQLGPGGRMVIPVGGVFQVQNLMFVEKKDDGSVSTESIMPVRFVPLTGGPRN